MIVVSDSSPIPNLGLIRQLELLPALYTAVLVPPAVHDEMTRADEAEVIVLAMERGAGLLLMDERRGRSIASSMGLSISGLLGVLAEAKRAGLIEAAKPVLDDLMRIAGFWVAGELYTRALSEFGED